MLTEREKWLMRKAWSMGFDSCEGFSNYHLLDDWLSDMAADAVTVEMVLAQEAPQL